MGAPMYPARLGPYELLTPLAAGGMAEIYAARKLDEPDQIAIVKRMLPQFATNPAFVEMFFDEGRTVSLLRHPNVVRMFYFGFEGDTPYLAMEYLHGVDVRAILRTTMHQRRRLPIGLALLILAKVCAGLHHAHEAHSLDGRPLEIVHRDVSPQNVLTTFDGEVKLIDFGIARSRDRTHETRAGSLKGKVPYMAPEQIRNTALDRRTDLYAVGVMLYELLTYRRPYVIEDGQEPQGEFALMMAIVGHHIAPPRSVRPDLPPVLERIVLRALAARPANRYQTAAELQHELESAARELGLAASEDELASFLREIFGDDARRWQEERRAELHEVVTRIEQVGRLRGSDDDAATHAVAHPRPSLVDRSATSGQPAPGAPRRAPPPRSPAEPQRGSGQAQPAAPPSRASSSAEGVGGAESVGRAASVGGAESVGRAASVGGAESVGRAASVGGAEGVGRGPVVLDLSTVQRFGPDGLRGWLEQRGALAGQGAQSELYLARCSEAVLGHLGLVRAFAGRGQVVSFVAPYACQRCGHELEVHFDCERDGAELQAATAPVRACSRCGGAAALDGDPMSLAPVRPFLGQAVPAPVRATLDRLEAEARAGGVADKQIEARCTRVRLTRSPDRGFRWRRLLDGAEGEVVLEVGALADDPVLLEGLVTALAGLGPEVTGVRIAGASLALARRLERQPRCKVDTVMARGLCAGCGSWRRVAIDWDDVARSAGPIMAPPCRRCGGALASLTFDDAGAAELVAGGAGRAPTPAVAPSPAAPRASIEAAPLRHGARWRRWPLVVAVALALGGAGLAYALAGARARPELVPCRGARC